MAFIGSSGGIALGVRVLVHEPEVVLVWNQHGVPVDGFGGGHAALRHPTAVRGPLAEVDVVVVLAESVPGDRHPAAGYSGDGWAVAGVLPVANRLGSGHLPVPQRRQEDLA